MIALNLRDPREEVLPAVGLVELRDAETGERALVDTFDSNVAQQVCGGSKSEVGSASRHAPIGRLSIRLRFVATQDYMLPLVKFFRMRERRI